MKRQERSAFTYPLTKPLGGRTAAEGDHLGDFTVTCICYDHGSKLEDGDRYGADIEEVDANDSYGQYIFGGWRGKHFLECLEAAGQCSILDDLRAAADAHARKYWEGANEQGAAAHVDKLVQMPNNSRHPEFTDEELNALDKLSDILDAHHSTNP